jgi:hypothetical protein
VQEALKVPARVWRAAFENLLDDDLSGELDKIKALTLIRLVAEHPPYDA